MHYFNKTVRVHTSIIFGLLLLILCCVLARAEVILVANEVQYAKDVLRKPRAIVKFFASWCPSCGSVKKAFEDVSYESEFNFVTFVDIDIDKVPEVSKQNSIIGVPTFVYVEDGKIKEQDIGVYTAGDFKKHLRDKMRKVFVVKLDSGVVKKKKNIKK